MQAVLLDLRLHIRYEICNRFRDQINSLRLFLHFVRKYFYYEHNIDHIDITFFAKYSGSLWKMITFYWMVINSPFDDF